VHITNDIKDVNRLRKILQVFFEEGFGHYILKSRYRKHLSWGKRFKIIPPPSEYAEAAIHLRHAFERLGPTFVKLGQLLSLRPDLVPLEFCRELEHLQDHVPPFPYEQVQKIIEEDLKQPLSTIFSSFNPVPIASASMAQVHSAVLKSGQRVAVKVQRPGIQEIIDTDLDILFHLAHSLESHFPDTQNYRPMGVVKEFAYWTRRELNFKIEAQSAQRLCDELKDNHKVLVPKVYREYSSRRIMVQDFVEGSKLDDMAVLKRNHINPSRLAMTYFTSILEQALLHGFFHADPHPANIFVDKHGKLIYLDYGIMGYLPREDRDKVIKFIVSLSERDADKSMDIIASLARDVSKGDVAQFKQEALPILEEIYGFSIAQKSVGSALYEIISLGAKYNIIFDPNHILVAKTFYQAEGMGLKLNPKFKLREGFETFAKLYLKKNYSPQKIVGDIAGTFWKQRNLLFDLPDHLARIVERMENPEPRHVFEIQQLLELEQEFEKANKRKTMSLIIAALILSSAVLFYMEGRTELFGLPLSLVMFLTALILMFVFIIYKKGGGWYDGKDR